MSGQDIAEIINTVNLYPIAVDTLNFDLFDNCFTEDAVVDFGGPAVWKELAAMKRDFLMVHEPFKATQHSTSNHRVEIKGDRANCISYVNARFVRDVENGDNVFEVSGWYDDVLVRTGAGWRITHRINRTYFQRGNPVVMQTLPGVTGELEHMALSAEAKAGRVEFVNALKAR